VVPPVHSIKVIVSKAVEKSNHDAETWNWRLGSNVRFNSIGFPFRTLKTPLFLLEETDLGHPIPGQVPINFFRCLTLFKTESFLWLRLSGTHTSSRHDLTSSIGVCWTWGLVGAPNLAPSALEDSRRGVGGIAANLTDRRDTGSGVNSAAGTDKVCLPHREAH
jgi:hypothetical protein